MKVSPNMYGKDSSDDCDLTPKLLWPVFCSFMKFGQVILVRVLMLNF